MTTWKIIRVATLLAMVAALAVGCARERAAENAASKPQPGASGSAADPAPPSESPAGASGAEADGAAAGEVQLAGLLGCGHCTFHVTPECSPCVKTRAGDVYVIDGVGEDADLWEKRLEEGHQITVTGTVLGSDKLKHVAMTSFEIK